MAALRAPFGFKPSRNINGAFDPATKRYKVEFSPRPIFSGDPVIQTSGMDVRCITVPVTSGTSARPIGVVSQCLDTNMKPLVFSQPTRGPFLPCATSAFQGYVDVYVNPFNVYWAATDLTAAPNNVGAYVSVTALGSATQNNITGRSPIGITIGSETSAVGTKPFQIVGPSPITRDYLTNPDWVDGVEVIIATILVGPRASA